MCGNQDAGALSSPRQRAQARHSSSPCVQLAGQVGRAILWSRSVAMTGPWGSSGAAGATSVAASFEN